MSSLAQRPTLCSIFNKPKQVVIFVFSFDVEVVRRPRNFQPSMLLQH